jgi:hypothetical protein
MTRYLKRKSYLVGWVLLAGSALLTGCGGAVGVKLRDTVLIETVPPGAQVKVSGRDIGVTPISVDLDQAFPRHWTTRVKTDDEGFAFYRRLEMLDLKKEGCETYTQQIVEPELARDIKITLKCDPNYQPGVVAAPAAVSTPAPVPAVGIEQRLRTVEDLKAKGLITEDEYRTQRQRILDGL